jgi:cytochrome c553
MGSSGDVAALESLLVGLIVFGCTLFSVWRLMSVRLRLKTLEALSVLPAAAGGHLVARLRRKTLAKLSGGCGACHQATHTLNANVQSLNRRPAAPRR